MPKVKIHEHEEKEMNTTKASWLLAIVAILAMSASVYADSWSNCNNNYVVNRGWYDSYGNYMKIDYGVCLQTSYYDTVNGKRMYPWIFVMAVTADPNEGAGWRVTASGVNDRCGATMQDVRIDLVANALYSGLLGTYYSPVPGRTIDDSSRKWQAFGVTVKLRDFQITVEYKWEDLITKNETRVSSLTTTRTMWDRALATGGLYSDSAWSWKFAAAAYVDIGPKYVRVVYAARTNYWKDAWPYPCTYMAYAYDVTWNI